MDMKNNKINKIIVIFVIITIILGFSFAIYASEMDKTDVVCSDVNLFNALKKELPSSFFINYDIKTQTISIPTESLNKITSLTLKNSGITDLTGLEKFVNLTELNLSNNSISSIAPLNELNSLTNLNLSDNKSIGNSSELLQTKKELSTLNLANTGLANISFISNLKKIVNLDISNNSISNLQPLQTLNEIRILNLSNNKNLVTIDYIKNHIALTELNISGTGITNLGDTYNHIGIQNLRNLKVLNVRGLNVQDLTPIVDKYYNEADEEFHAFLEQITTLDISYTIGLSFSELEILKNITDLYMLGDNIYSVYGISHLENLKYVNLEENQIQDISQFVEYNYDENGVQYISKRLTAKEIILKHNQISNINVLNYLGDIDYLDLSENKIYNTSSLENKRLSKGLHLERQNVELEVYKKSAQVNQYIILPQIIQQTKNKASKLYYENIDWKIEGMTFNQDANYQSPGDYNVIIDYEKTYEDKISITLDGGIADETVINYKVVQSSNAIDSLIFNDENLCEAIYHSLLNNKSEYSTLSRAKSILNIEQAEISRISELNLAGYKIRDLTGLESFENLRNLNVSENSFTTIEPLKYCKNITDLNASNSPISNNNNAIIELKQLRKLDLSNTGMTNIDNLNKFINSFEEWETCYIDDLNLSSNAIEDITGIEKMSEIQNLYISNNKLSDISNLEKLTKLKVLNVSSNNIEDISKLANIVTLRTLNISNNKIKDISSIYKGITAFYFSGNNVKDITSLKKMTSLTDLVMNNNKIEDITAIQNILINHEFSMEQQEIVRIIENDITGNVEIELPQVFKSSKEKNSKVYTEDDFELKNCTFENNKIIVDTDELQDNIALVRITSGNAKGSTLAISKPIKATISYSTEDFTNKDVTATISFSRSNVTITNNDGKDKYIFSQNGEFKFEFADENGITGEETAKVNCIDKEKPLVTGVEEGKIYSKVVIPTISDENLNEVTLTKNGTKVEDYKAGNEITGDGNYVLTAKDKAQNITTVSFKIQYIPTKATISYSSKDFTNNDVTATISFNKSTVTVTNNNGQEEYIFKQNGSFTFKYVDENGEKGEEKAEVNWIDKIAPVISGVENSKTYVESVTPTITDENLSEVTLTKDGKNVSNFKSGIKLEENGDYVLIAKDKAGNTTKVTFKINQKTVKPGDVNQNEIIDIGDILHVLRHIAAKSDERVLNEHKDWILDGAKVQIADVNKNGSLDIGDILKMLRYISATTDKNIAKENPSWLEM